MPWDHPARRTQNSACDASNLALPSIWTFEGLTEPFTVSGDAAPLVLRELATLLPGWRPAPGEHGAGNAVHITFNQTGNAIHLLDSAGQEIGGDFNPSPDPFSAAYRLTAALFEVMAFAQPNGLVLHAGAVMTQNQAIAFAAPSEIGKSILGAACALAGKRLLGDDRIIVSSTGDTSTGNRHMAHPLGLAQKIRLPLPDAIVDEFAPLLSLRPGRRIADSLFLDWDEAVQMPPGKAVPLSALVLLHRDGATPPRMERPSQPQAVRALLQLSAAPGGPTRHLAAVRALVDHVPVTALHYASCFEALDAIADLGHTPRRSPHPTPVRMAEGG